uniref:ULP_PROTEASE domain-containing protein n=1 Tax=Macrostomum lignano TaxID=282301 RepID=A0A1I8IWD8_9PLAT
PAAAYSGLARPPPARDAQIEKSPWGDFSGGAGQKRRGTDRRFKTGEADRRLLATVNRSGRRNKFRKTKTFQATAVAAAASAISIVVSSPPSVVRAGADPFVVELSSSTLSSSASAKKSSSASSSNRRQAETSVSHISVATENLVHNRQRNRGRLKCMPPTSQLQQQQQPQVVLVQAPDGAASVSGPAASSLDKYHFYNDPVISREPAGRQLHRPPGRRGGSSKQQQQRQQPQQQLGSYVVTPTGELVPRQQPVSILKQPGGPKSVRFSLDEGQPIEAGPSQLAPRLNRRQTRDAISAEEVAAAAVAYQRGQAQQSTFVIDDDPASSVEPPVQRQPPTSPPEIIVQDENEAVFYKEFGGVGGGRDLRPAPTPRRPRQSAPKERGRFEAVADDSDEDREADRYHSGSPRKSNGREEASKTGSSRACTILQLFFTYGSSEWGEIEFTMDSRAKRRARDALPVSAFVKHHRRPSMDFYKPEFSSAELAASLTRHLLLGDSPASSSDCYAVAMVSAALPVAEFEAAEYPAAAEWRKKGLARDLGMLGSIFCRIPVPAPAAPAETASSKTTTISTARPPPPPKMRQRRRRPEASVAAARVEELLLYRLSRCLQCRSSVLQERDLLAEAAPDDEDDDRGDEAETEATPRRLQRRPPRPPSSSSVSRPVGLYGSARVPDVRLSGDPVTAYRESLRVSLRAFRRRQWRPLDVEALEAARDPEDIDRRSCRLGRGGGDGGNSRPVSAAGSAARFPAPSPKSRRRRFRAPDLNLPPEREPQFLLASSCLEPDKVEFSAKLVLDLPRFEFGTALPDPFSNASFRSLAECENGWRSVFPEALAESEPGLAGLMDRLIAMERLQLHTVRMEAARFGAAGSAALATRRATSASVAGSSPATGGGRLRSQNCCRGCL